MKRKNLVNICKKTQRNNIRKESEQKIQKKMLTDTTKMQRHNGCSYSDYF